MMSYGMELEHPKQTKYGYVKMSKSSVPIKEGLERSIRPNVGLRVVKHLGRAVRKKQTI